MQMVAAPSRTVLCRAPSGGIAHSRRERAPCVACGIPRVPCWRMPDVVVHAVLCGTRMCYLFCYCWLPFGRRYMLTVSNCCTCGRIPRPALRARRRRVGSGARAVARLYRLPRTGVAWVRVRRPGGSARSARVGFDPRCRPGVRPPGGGPARAAAGPRPARGGVPRCITAGRADTALSGSVRRE